MATRPNYPGVDQADELVSGIRNFGPAWRFDGEPYLLWEQQFKNLIRRAYPSEYDERLAEFEKILDYRRTIPVQVFGEPDRSSEVFQIDFQANRPRVVAYAKALRDDLVARTSLPTSESDKVEDMPLLRIFIVHDGPTGARSKLEDFIRALGAEPVTAENEPSKGRTVSDKVDAVLDTCHYAIALATKARGSKQDGRILARGNVTNELPRVRKALGDRWMVVLEHGVELPSNESGFVHERFWPQSMDQVFMALVRELRGHRIITLQPTSAQSPMDKS
jgi:predicted nucleotide-binding protein